MGAFHKGLCYNIVVGDIVQSIVWYLIAALVLAHWGGFILWLKNVCLWHII